VVVLDGDSSDESPVKATPPAVAAASAETSGAGKQGQALKCVLTKVPAVSAMDVDSGRNTSRVAVQNGAQGGHALIPEMIEKSVRADAVFKGSDEMRAENLALLRDMRGTCVKMVEEAKSQSLLVTEKILEETRVKTTQIVEEARVNSSLIMEELRLVIERLGTFAGQRSETNGSLGGRWCGMYDDPFQGLSLDNGKLSLGDPNNVKWLEQRDAEQGLIIQRLELVQEQARIQLEGIRLKLNIQKQQGSVQDKQA